MSRRPLPLLFVLACLLAGACTSTAPGIEDPSVAEATPTPASTSTPTPTPTPPPTPTPTPTPEPTPIIETDPEPLPITVAVERLDTELLDNAALRGAAQRPLDDAVVLQAAEEVRATLERYLMTQFVEADTRFGPAGLEALLSPGTVAALTDEQRRGLGQLEVAGREIIGARATADLLVLVDGADVLSVTATYTAPLAVLGGATPVELRQSGSLVLTRQDDRWLADIADVRLDVTGDPAAAA